MSKVLSGKVAVVTGAAGAIGYGICEVLLENGATLVATDLAGEKLDAFAKDLDCARSGQSIGSADGRHQPRGRRRRLDEVYAKFGRLDIMIHNAGIAYVSKIVDMDIARFQLLEKVNVDGTLVVLKETGKRMIDKGGRRRHRRHVDQERPSPSRRLRRLQRDEGGLPSARPHRERRVPRRTTSAST